MITRWPKDERIAVMVTVMFEVWSEGKAPPYSPMTTALKPGTLDLLGISWSQYGGKTGIWRLMRILREAAIRGTVCLNAKAAEDFPESVKELSRDGHEIAGHSYTQDLILPYLEPKDEQKVIERCTAIIEKAIGVRPSAGSVRWRRQEHTRQTFWPAPVTSGTATTMIPIFLT
jgi:peptidoglycan/xylan/chitin deacetylase (PgdA/CDA1 family)